MTPILLSPSGKMDRESNVLKNAPHTIMEARASEPRSLIIHSDIFIAFQVMAEEWNRPYSRAKAVYPLKSLKQDKFWPTTSRLNDTYARGHLVLPMDTHLSTSGIAGTEIGISFVLAPPLRLSSREKMLRRPHYRPHTLQE